MASTLGTIRHFNCRLLNDRARVHVIVHRDVVLSVPVRHRDATKPKQKAEASPHVQNMVVAFQCKSQARLAREDAVDDVINCMIEDSNDEDADWDLDELRTHETSVESLRALLQHLQMPAIVITNGHCDLSDRHTAEHQGEDWGLTAQYTLHYMGAPPRMLKMN